MGKTNLLIFFLIVTLSINLVSASEFEGDGTHIVQIGDFVNLNNGWRVEMEGIFMAHAGPQVQFNIYDPSGDKQSEFPEYLNKYEGKMKYGSDTMMAVEMEISEVSGETSSTGSPMVTKYEKAEITFSSISVALPGVVKQETKKMNKKEIHYENGKSTKVGKGELLILGNGYKLEFKSYNSRWKSPDLTLYDEQGTLIDDISIAEDISISVGSVITVKSSNEEAIEVEVVEGSKLTFGTGWNLFSISIDDGDGYGRIIESDCNNALMWIWDSENENYKNIGRLEKNTKVPSNTGIWVKVQSDEEANSQIDCTALVSGTRSVSTKGKMLNAGWNLIGAPISAYGKRELVESGSIFDFLEFREILGDCELESGPWQYLGTPYTHFSITSEVAREGRFSEPFENRMALGRGYFIKVKEDCTLGDI